MIALAPAAITLIAASAPGETESTMYSAMIRR